MIHQFEFRTMACKLWSEAFISLGTSCMYNSCLAFGVLFVRVMTTTGPVIYRKSMSRSVLCDDGAFLQSTRSLPLAAAVATLTTLLVAFDPLECRPHPKVRSYVTFSILGVFRF